MKRTFPELSVSSLATALLLCSAVAFLCDTARADGLADSPSTPPATVHVKDFGAVADDGECDVAAITRAIASVQEKPGSVIVFDAGVYNLKEESATRRNNNLAMIHLTNLEGITLRGATTADGEPATVLEMNLELDNDITGATHIDIRRCRNIRIENIVLDHLPRFATAAEIIAVDRNADIIEIEVFPDMPHFDGMMSYSANNWDLETRLLIRGPALTIGLNQGAFRTWRKVAGQERRYRIARSGFSNHVSTGEGISFHFNLISGDARTVDIYGCEDIAFENIHMHSTIGMSVGAGDNRNLTFRRFHIKPEGNSLAVGPRDGFHINRSTGRLLMEDVVVKGVRWDPIVSYTQSRKVTERTGESSVRVPTPGLANLMRPGTEVVFWVGEVPHHAVVRETGGDRIVTFTEPLPPSVVAGTHFTPEAWRWDEAIIRNSLVEANYGTAVVYQNANLLLENNVFRNNSYSNIGLGPTSGGAGFFAWNVVIRNNLFEQSTWDEKYRNTVSAHRGTITMFQNHPDFVNQPYNRNILIENNVFRDLDVGTHAAAVHVKNARDVTLRRNRYENVNNRVIIDPGSTHNIRNDAR